MARATMSRRKTVKLIIGAALLIVVAVWFRVCLPPSQRSLVRKFERHKNSFEKVRAMLEEDRAILGGVASYGCMAPGNWISHRPDELGLSQERYAEYLRLLKRAGAMHVIRRTEETSFLVAGSGFAGYGWRIAITHRDTEPNDVIRSLRKFRHGRSTHDKNQAYCPIEGNWYIRIIW